MIVAGGRQRDTSTAKPAAGGLLFEECPLLTPWSARLTAPSAMTTPATSRHLWPGSTRGDRRHALCVAIQDAPVRAMPAATAPQFNVASASPTASSQTPASCGIHAASVSPVIGGGFFSAQRNETGLPLGWVEAELPFRLRCCAISSVRNRKLPNKSRLCI